MSMASTSSSSTMRLLHLPNDEKENLWDSTHVDGTEESLLCSHAMAQGKTVYGTTTASEGEDWISWRTTLDHPVGQLCSNDDGSIVVASTTAGTVSLLAGKDGTLLATRMVSKSQGVANVVFSSSSGNDALSIVVPDLSQTITQIVLVSNIDGPALNSEETVTEATRSMAIDALSFPLSNVVHIKAVHHGSGLRFALVTTEGNLFFFYYANKQVTLVGKSDLAVQVGAGLRVQRHAPTNTTYFVFSTAKKKGISSIVWLETSQLTAVCEIALKNKVIALEPLRSCSCQSAMALAVATKDVIQVVQACVDETMGLTILQRVQVVYQIPMTGRTISSIAMPYAFRFIGQGDMIREFKPSPFAGRIRLLLQQDRFDEAMDVVQELVAADQDYSDFHPSELHLRRLQHVLKNQVTADTMGIAQSCLQQLVRLDGSMLAVDNLLCAADDILQWHAPSIASYRLALSSMSQTLGCAEAPPAVSDRLHSKQLQLDSASEAMEALLALLGNEDAPIEGPFLQVRNMSDLLKTILSEGLYGAAFTLHQSIKTLTPETIVSAIVSLPPGAAIDPRHYIPLLESGILGLSVKHGLLPTINAWACQTANALVPDLKSAIYLLQHVHNAMIQLHARIFSSFASFCPFVDASPRISSPRNTDASISFRSGDSTSCPPSKKKTNFEQPVPTILELGKLKGGAIKSHRLALHEDDDDCEDIEVKLRHAQLLCKAGDLGLATGDLRHFVRRGGAMFLARELVQLFSRKATTPESRIELLQSKVMPFCVESEVSFDEVLVCYGEEICESKQMSLSMVSEASSLARCCVGDSAKCRITLTVLRAALLCGAATPCLAALSCDAIQWAGGDLTMRSELTEASRLLVISSIVVTYCGKDAALELFRVDNPSHASKLLAHVCRHISHPEALADALKLCDAFAHLTKEHASIQMLEVSILSGSVDSCSNVMAAIFTKDMSVAQSIWERGLEFCSILMLDKCETLRSSNFRPVERDHAMLLCSKALALLEIVQDHIPTSLLASTNFQYLLDSYQRVQRLQRHHDIFVSPLEMDCRHVTLTIIGSLVASIRNQFEGADGDTLSHFEKARRAAQLLVGADEVSSVWFGAVEREACQLVWSSNDGKCVQFLVESGTLNNLSSNEAAQAVLAVVLNYCKRASKGTHQSNDNNIVSQMKFVLRASQLLHDYVLVGCPFKLIAAVSSLSSLTETIGRVLLMADNGVGDELQKHRRQLRLWNCAALPTEENPSKMAHSVCKKPILHSEWYVGDGLLLPLDETHGGCVEFCMDLVGLILCNESPNLRGSEQLHGLLDERGAHATALRVGCLTMANVLSFSIFSPGANYQNLISFANSYQTTLKSLAERSLGGSGNGITNPKVDCGLALSYIHLLPTKMAFQVYKASLPSAVTQRDFKRVRTLSIIGIVAGKGLQSVAGFVPASWKKQGMFVEQCERLSMRACWWIALQRFEVDFEPRRFDESSTSDPATPDPANGARQESHYAATLLLPLITNCCAELKDADMARNVAFSYAGSFGVDKQLAAQKHVEVLVTCPAVARGFTFDVRFDLPACEKAARVSLKEILSPMKRSAVLRKALVGLESTDEYDFDYERYGLLLSLYYDDLALVVGSDAIKRKIDVAPFAAELESIARRRDALSVLMSFFEGELLKHRPAFPKFFNALPIVFGLDTTGKEQPRVGLLGPIESSPTEAFDPLGPLHQFLSVHSDASTATALAPLCIPLNLPPGYVHARVLVSRFLISASSQTALPSLETEVVPVLNRLKSSTGQSTLAEWCASMYDENDIQKVKCLDIALEHAMNASSEIECRMSRDKSCDRTREHQDALERVRRVSNEKSILADKNQVKNILIMSKYGDADHYRAAKRMIDDLTTRLNDDLWRRADAAPDKFVELFLTEASAIAAAACLSTSDLFALDHLRYMASVVHKACKEISDQYSHVHASALCRKLARKWLVHGDSASDSSDFDTKVIKTRALPSPSFDDDENETMNFVMDLSEIGDGLEMWSNDIRSALRDQKDEGLVTREEEPNALDDLGSAREVSESDCAKVALRIAFVMSFAEGYHPKNTEFPVLDSENSGDTNNKTSKARDGQIKKRRGLLSRIPAGESNHDAIVMDHGRELLRIVFAKSGANTERLNEQSTSFYGATGNNLGVKATTFAMRYRALRTAAILCPQEALERIIKDEGFLLNVNGDTLGSLRQCAFGAFVAKEIEEMGLALPHSDLSQLSTMQFSSYARALRRNHDTNSLKGKGRLLLLLIEMSTVPGHTWDLELVKTVLMEMRVSNLPRSLLCACERCLQFIDTGSGAMNPDALGAIADSITVLVDCCLKQASTALSIKGVATLSRVAALVQRLHDTKPDLARMFADVLQGMLASSKEVSMKIELSEVLAKVGSPNEPKGETSSSTIDTGTLKGRLAALHQ
ncbi:hypothetical protein MHU86_14380 [Fragilaria crotonensis]|nr:hypothetical protein MHU86_14380 [Fragilaria crotonensis]